MMRFVPRKRFRRNKSRNHTAPQGEDLRTYAGFHSTISRFFVHHVGRFPLPKVSRRHSPRQAGFVHHIDEKKRSGEVAPRSWRDAATTRFGRHWHSISYKTERGNVAKNRPRFHATIKIVSDYQCVTNPSVAASRLVALASKISTRRLRLHFQNFRQWSGVHSIVPKSMSSTLKMKHTLRYYK